MLQGQMMPSGKHLYGMCAKLCSRTTEWLGCVRLRPPV